MQSKRKGFFFALSFVFLLSGILKAEPDRLNWNEFGYTATKDFTTNLPSRMWNDSRTIFEKDENWIALLLAGGASVAMHNSNADDNVADNFERHGVFNHDWDRVFALAGNPGTHFAATGVWYFTSLSFKDDLNRERAWTMMTALSINGLITVGLKAARDNDTPNGKSWAWPSGHTSSSFTVASVLDEFYGPKIGIPAYIAASTVAVRMMDSGDHWASDVVFGATLGWIVGHGVAGKYMEFEIAGFRPEPLTMIGGYPVTGVNFVKRF